jgi:chromate reductase, NAD(P)H dehydrogenase (quinone)
VKNAIDWASRPHGHNAWDAKPVAVIEASIGMLGTARAQYHLRQSFVFLNMYSLNQPEVMIANAGSKFGEQGNFKEETRLKLVSGQMFDSFAANPLKSVSKASDPACSA